jgi:Mn-dependent DtxR family transcriptional regulator
VNKSSVAVILKRLETKGHIVKSPYDRSIALTD